MLEESDLTLDQLLARWREAEIAVNGTPLGTRDHDQAVREAEAAGEAYRYRLAVMAQDLRDG